MVNFFLLPLLFIFCFFSAFVSLADSTEDGTINTVEDKKSQSSLHLSKYYFYQKINYGSETQFNPLNPLINIGFDIVRHHTYSNDPFAIDYKTGFKNVFSNIFHPIDNINAIGGFDEFISHEVFPYKGIDKEHLQFVPNYSLHLLGEGLVYRKLWEWYDAEGFAYPYLWSAFTIIPIQLLNEFIENGNYDGANSDPIADILLFNPLSILLFSFDKACSFFSGPARANYWPNQASVDVRNGRLFNLGENYSLKVTLGKWTDYRLFGYSGNRGLFGLTIPIKENHDLSIGIGSRVTRLEPIYEDNSRIILPRGERNIEIGAFWDKKESLLLNLIASMPPYPAVELNLYPGILHLWKQTFGFFFFLSQIDGLGIGLTFKYLPIVPSINPYKDKSYEIYYE